MIKANKYEAVIRVTYFSEDGSDAEADGNRMVFYLSEKFPIADIDLDYVEEV